MSSLSVDNTIHSGVGSHSTIYDNTTPHVKFHGRRASYEYSACLQRGEGVFTELPPSFLISPQCIRGTILWQLLQNRPLKAPVSRVLCLHELLHCVHVRYEHGKQPLFVLVSTGREGMGGPPPSCPPCCPPHTHSTMDPSLGLVMGRTKFTSGAHDVFT